MRSVALPKGGVADRPSVNNDALYRTFLRNVFTKIKVFEFIATLVNQFLMNVSAKVNVFEFIVNLESPVLLNVSTKINVFASIATLPK